MVPEDVACQASGAAQGTERREQRQTVAGIGANFFLREKPRQEHPESWQGDQKRS